MTAKQQHKAGTRENLQPAGADAAWLTPTRLGVGALVVAGLVARLIAILAAPQTSYLPDHKSIMGWSEYAWRHGPWAIYDKPAGDVVLVRRVDPRSGQTADVPERDPFSCNYPPLSGYVFAIQGAVWQMLDHDVKALPIPEETALRAGLDPSQRYRVIDTRASRLAGAVGGVAFDFVLACGVAALVRTLSSARRRWREILAFGIVLLAPPIFLDSAFWTQVDSWITCLLVWCLVMLMRRRWLLAGVLYGAALMTKPQAILFGPVYVYVFFALRFMQGGTWRQALQLWKTAVMALVVAAIIALPVMLHDGASPTNQDGVFRWFKRSYTGTIGAERFKRSTFSALNIWWLDMLTHGPPPREREAYREWQERAYGVDQTVLGLRRDRLGLLLLSVGILTTWAGCARKYRWSADSWPVVVYLTLFAAFFLPTAAHERYIYYCIPPVIALAVHSWVWIFPAAVLVLVGTFEMTQFLWMRAIHDPDVRIRSALLALLVVAAFVYSLIALIPRSKAATGKS